MGGHAAPSWSHDGRDVAFSVFEAGPGNGVWIHSRETGDTVHLDPATLFVGVIGDRR